MKKPLLIVAAVVAIVAVAWIGFGVWERINTPPLIEYKIEGTAASALVAIELSDGSTEYHIGVTMPCSYKFTEFTGTHLSVMAQNEGEVGSVMVSIYHNGKLMASHAAAGPFAKATASCPLP